MRVHDRWLRARVRQRTWRGGRRSCPGTKGGGTGGECQERRPGMIEQRYRHVLALLKGTNMLHRGLAVGSAVVLLMVAAHPLFAPAREVPSFTRQEDVIYARKHGTA